MSLLSVTVKKANFVGPEAPQFNTYVTLKLQNVKSTTVTVKGATPCWEQDFLFETNDVNTGLLIEVWSKGMIWDRAMGYHWLPLQGIQYSNEEGTGQWLSLEGELVMRESEVVGTKTPTGHALLVDCRFELPFGRCDPPSGWRSLLQDAASFRQDYNSSLPSQSNHHDAENIGASDLQRKLELLNNVMDHEARAEQARRQIQYYGHSGYSEDSDYTSDLNFPVGQHANSSASQFRNAAHQMRTPQMSLETSRENSYERDDGQGPLTPQPSPYQHHLPVTSSTRNNHLSPGSLRRQRFSPNTTDDFGYVGSNSNQYHQKNYQQENNMMPADSDPLFYNSRPMNKTDYSSYDTLSNFNQNYNYNELSIESVDRGFGDTTDYINKPSSLSKFCKPSLERQTTLDYTTSLYDGSNYINNQDSTTIVSYVNTSGQSLNRSNYDEYYDASSYPYHEERYGRDQDEDRQWDAGGLTALSAKKLPAVPISTILNNTKPRSSMIANDLLSLGGTNSPAPRRIMPQVPPLGGRRATSRQGSLHELEDGYPMTEFGHRGASLPPTPTKLQAAKLLPRVPITSTTKAFNSLPPTPGRQLPKPNLNHRSANKTSSWSHRNQFTLKRTISADYADELLEDDDDDDVTNISGYDIAGLNGTALITNVAATSFSNHITNNESNSYIRPGTMSANQMYNEDYNYAYQSTDNLPVVPAGVSSTSAAVLSSFTITSTVSTSLPTQQYQPIIINSGLAPMTDLDEISPYGDLSTSSDVITSAPSNTTTINAGYDNIMGVTNVTSNAALLNHQYSTEDYYYNAQEDLGQISDVYNTIDQFVPISTTTSTVSYSTTSTTTNLQERRKLLLGANGSRRGTSPLATLHPADSFDSRDEDTLRDSFETAVSSIDYPLINSYADATSVVNTSAYDCGKSVSTTYTSYQRDQPTQQPKAISTATTSVTGTTTTSVASEAATALPSLPSLASGFSAATSMFGKMSGMAKGFLKQQTIDPGIFTPQPQHQQHQIPHSQPPNQHISNYIPEIDETLEYDEKNGYTQQQYNNNNTLERFNSIDSYLEEDEELYVDPSKSNNGLMNGGLDYQYNSSVIGNQMQIKDSSVSVIHVSDINVYDDEQLVMRRGSSQITVVDPYAQQQRGTVSDPYSVTGRASTEGYGPQMINGGQSIRRTSQESYHEYLEEDDMMADIPVTSHMDTITYQQNVSAIDQYQFQLDQQQHHILSDVGMLEDVAEEEELEEQSPPLVAPVEKKVSFEDEEVILNGTATAKIANGNSLIAGLMMDDRLLEEEAKPARPQITAQQRWHWAYNKIIMQLNC